MMRARRGDRESRALIDRAIELAGAGAYSDATAPLWCSMFQSLTERTDRAGLQLADALLAAVEEADRAGVEDRPGGDRPPARVGPVSRADEYRRLQEDPGPYRGLAVDAVDERLRRLSAA